MGLLGKYHSFDLDDAEKALTLRKSWWAAIAILPAAKRISLFFANRTRITPNLISLVSFHLWLMAACLFGFGRYPFLVFGALLFELNYLLDCVDGTVSRLTKQSSPVGAFLDFILDQWRILFCLGGLVFGQYYIEGSLRLIPVAFYYLALKLIYQFHGDVQHSMASRFDRWIIETSLENKSFGIFNSWKRFAEKRKLSFPMRAVETDTIIFFVGPILNQVFWGMIVGSMLLTIFYIFCVLRLVSFLRENLFEKELKEILCDSNIKDIAVFGTGAATGNFLSWCESNGLDGKVSYFLDNDTDRQGSRRFDRPVYNPDVLLKDNPDLVVVTSRAGHWDIANQLEAMGMSEDKDFIYANFTK